MSYNQRRKIRFLSLGAEHPVHTAPNHLSAVELEQGLPEVLAAPRDGGRLEAIVIRPAENERRVVTAANLSIDGGVEGDRWVRDSYYRLDDGRSDPRCQVSLMNARFLRQIAGEEDAICLAGDNLIVELDLSEENLPSGSWLAIGDAAVLEITDLPHTGCGKLAGRYGTAVKTFMNDARGKSLHLRGRYARVVAPGTIRVGDGVRKA